MKDAVKNEIMKELNFVEKIVVKVFKKTFIKVYNITRINTVNNLLE